MDRATLSPRAQSVYDRLVDGTFALDLDRVTEALGVQLLGHSPAQTEGDHSALERAPASLSRAR
ncbi:hypothetical protein [Haliangium sp.]|uniref:hypothetical protein n=1 Tax=Haliangium sp. TaxID=2663208 RepID=UPI003D0AFA4F